MSGHIYNHDNTRKNYQTPTSKQQANRRKHARKMERNEQLRAKYPPYHPRSNINIIHIHHQTPINIIEQLIHKAQGTHIYTIDTESKPSRDGNVGALVQIEMVHSIYESTVVLMETYYLPDVNSHLIRKMKQWWSIIFNSGNEIISWGPTKTELKDFGHIEWMKLGMSKLTNLQSLFQDWQDGVTHPVTERRVVITGASFDTPGDDEDGIYTNYVKQRNKYALQVAVETVLHQYLDKSITVNDWHCGLDPTLGTWRRQLLSRKYYNVQIEKQQRQKLIDYAVHDCTSVTEIFFIMYPERTNEINSNQNQATTSRNINQTLKITSTSYDYQNDIMDISDDESEIYLSQINVESKPAQSSRQNELIITTPQQAFEFELELEPDAELEPEFEIEPQAPKPSSKTTKAEQQKRKNEKFKLKKKYRPDFMNKIRRSIYHKYNYHNIRAQLRDDNIFPTHQIKIDRNKGGVKIVFRSQYEREHATKTIKINYFSKQQYLERWG